jgi:hypothetical protein
MNVPIMAAQTCARDVHAYQMHAREVMPVRSRP